MKHWTGMMEIKNTTWGKVLAVLMAVVFAMSTLSLTAFAAGLNDETPEGPGDDQGISMQVMSEDLEEEGEFGDNEGESEEDLEEEEVGSEEGTTEDVEEADGDETIVPAAELNKGVAKIGETIYESLQDAIAAAQAGDTVILMKDVTIDSTAGMNQAAIVIPAGVTLDGNNHTITAGTFAGAANMLGVTNAAGVKIQNLTVNMNKAANSKHALNVWGAGADVELENVALMNANTAGLMLNTGTVKSSSTKTSGNGWYGINVDKGGTLSGSVITNEQIGIFSEDANNGGSTVDIDGYVALYTNEGTIFDTEEKIAAQAVAHVEDGAYYVTLQAAINAAQDADTVILLADEATDKIIEVNKSITIEGNEHTVSSTANRILWIVQNDVNVTLNGINFESATAERGVQVNVDVTGVTLNISNCRIPGTYYAVNMCNGTNVALNIDNCDIRGWGALNLWGSTYEVKVSNSTLVGHNDKSYSATGWNGFGTIVLEGDTTGKTDDHVSGCHVVLDNCHIIASTVENADGSANLQRPILFNSQSANNVVEITGANTVVEYAQGDNTPFCSQNGSNNTLTVYEGSFSGDVSSYCSEDYACRLSDDGTYSIVTKEEITVAKIGETIYESLQDAIAAAQAGDTVILMKDVTIDSTAGMNQATIVIPAGVTLDGNNHTITAGTFADAAHMLGVNNAAGVKIQNLTVDMNKAANSKHALNVWGANANVTLTKVELKNANTAGLMLNAGAVDSNTTKTSGNGWYGINVDKSGTLTGNYSCSEEIPIYSEDAATEGGSIVKVKTYKPLYTVSNEGNLAVIYNNEDKAAAKISEQLFASLPAAVEIAHSGDTVTLLNNVEEVVVNKSVTLDLNDKRIEKITVVGNDKLREVTAILKNGTTGTIEVNNKGKIDLWTITANQIVANDGLVAIQGGKYGDISVSGANGKLYTTSGTFTGKVEFDGAGTMQIRGGEFAIDVSKYCEKGYEAPETANENDMYVVHPIKKVTDEAVAPTCSTIGLTEGTHCSVCGKTQKAQEEVAKIAHTEEIDAAVEPTCTETGLTEGKHCSVCGEIIAAQEEVAAKGHTEETVSGIAATCTETGLTGGVKCSVCDEVLTAQEEIPALGHAYGEWVVTTPAAAGVAGEQQRTCTRCGEVETQSIAALPSNPQVNPGNQGGTTDNGGQQQGTQQGTQQGGQQTTQGGGQQAAQPGGQQQGTQGAGQGGAGAVTQNAGTPATQPADETIADDATPLAAPTDETIDDDANPLAAPTYSKNAAEQEEGAGWLIPAIIIGIILVASLFFLIAKRRKKDEENSRLRFR